MMEAAPTPPPTRHPSLTSVGSERRRWLPGVPARRRFRRPSA